MSVKGVILDAEPAFTSVMYGFEMDTREAIDTCFISGRGCCCGPVEPRGGLSTSLAFSFKIPFGLTGFSTEPEDYLEPGEGLMGFSFSFALSFFFASSSGRAASMGAGAAKSPLLAPRGSLSSLLSTSGRTSSLGSIPPAAAF